MIDICPVCQSIQVSTFLEVTNVPIHCNVIWESQAESIQAPRGDIHLGFCRNCGHIFNLVFNPDLMKYDQDYENSLHFSPRFQQYAESLSRELIQRHNLTKKQIIEIGCGKGDFLQLLCNQGQNRGIGFDPSYEHHRNKNTNSPIEFIEDFYSSKYSNYSFDFICCRHVLEHLQFPSEFLNEIRMNINENSNIVVYFEVPNVNFILCNDGIWDIIYEHCSYFSTGSLAEVFLSNGFKVQSCRDAFSGQFLSIEASIKDNSTLKTDNTWLDVN